MIWILAAQNQPIINLGSKGFALRAIGLIVLAIGVYFVMAVPNWVRGREAGREAQLSAGLYAVLSSLAGLVIAVTGAVSSPQWFSEDRLHDPSVLTFLTMVLLFGAVVSFIAAQRLVVREFNLGCLLAWPAWLVGILDLLILCYYWFGPGSRPGSYESQPGGHGTLALGILTGVVAAAGILGMLIVYAQHQECRAIFHRALLVAIAGTVLQSIFILLRAPSTPYSRLHLYGVDLMLLGGVVGVFVFLISYRIGRAARRSQAPQQAAYAGT